MGAQPTCQTSPLGLVCVETHVGAVVGGERRDDRDQRADCRGADDLGSPGRLGLPVAHRGGARSVEAGLAPRPRGGRLDQGRAYLRRIRPVDRLALHGEADLRSDVRHPDVGQDGAGDPGVAGGLRRRGRPLRPADDPVRRLVRLGGTEGPRPQPSVVPLLLLPAHDPAGHGRRLQRSRLLRQRSLHLPGRPPAVDHGRPRVPSAHAPLRAPALARLRGAGLRP